MPPQKATRRARGRFPLKNRTIAITKASAVRPKSVSTKLTIWLPARAREIRFRGDIAEGRPLLRISVDDLAQQGLRLVGAPVGGVPRGDAVAGCHRVESRAGRGLEQRSGGHLPLVHPQ